MNDSGEAQCVISCSVLKEELLALKRRGDLAVDFVFVSKNFHVDYGLLERNLRRTIARTLPKLARKPVLVYGDLCLGQRRNETARPRIRLGQS